MPETMYGALETKDRDQNRTRRRRERPARRSSRTRLTRQGASRKLDKKRGHTAVFSNLFGAELKGHRNRTGRQAPVSSSSGNNHSFVYNLLNPRSHCWQAVLFKRFISAVIVWDLLFFVLSTEPQWADYRIFHLVEGVDSTIFLAEYIGRFATATESRTYGKHGAFMGRVRYMLSFPAIIDALATFPFFLEHLTGLNLPTLTYLRVFRLFRICKTAGYARAVDSVWRVMYYNREILWVALLVCVFLVLVTAVLMYYLRPPEELVDDVADFSSITATMYLSTLMLTGQGGPEGDLPWYTKGIVLLTGFFSVAMFAIPASMLTWGFEAEAERLAAKTRKKSLRRQRDPDSFDSNSSSSSDSDAYYTSSSADTSDEEYQKIIAGEDDDDGNGEERSANVGPQEVLLQELVELLKGRDTVAEGDGQKKTQPKTTCLVHRIESLEAKMDETNAKLDRLLEVTSQRHI